MCVHMRCVHTCVRSVRGKNSPTNITPPPPTTQRPRPTHIGIPAKKGRNNNNSSCEQISLPPPPPLHFGGVTVNVATDASGRGFDASKRGGGGGGGGGGNYGRSSHNRPTKMETHALLKYNRSFLSDDTMGPQTSFFKKYCSSFFFFGNSLSAHPHTQLPLLLFPLLSPSVGRKWVRKVAKSHSEQHTGKLANENLPQDT